MKTRVMIVAHDIQDNELKMIAMVTERYENNVIMLITCMYLQLFASPQKKGVRF